MRDRVYIPHVVPQVKKSPLKSRSDTRTSGRGQRPCATAALEKAVAAAAVTRIRIPPALLGALPLPSPPPASVQEGVTLPVEPNVAVVALLCALLLLASAGYVRGSSRPFVHPVQGFQSVRELACFFFFLLLSLSSTRADRVYHVYVHHVCTTCAKRV